MGIFNGGEYSIFRMGNARAKRVLEIILLLFISFMLLLLINARLI